MSVQNSKFNFLDISQYLPVGYSYAALLKAYKYPENRELFSFSYLDCYEHLLEKELPPYKGENDKRESRGGKEGPALLKGQAKWNYYHRIWKKHNMTSLKDFLVW